MFSRLSRRSREDFAKPARTAAYWVARRRLNLMTPEDERAFEVWQAEPQNAADYAAAEATVRDLDAVSHDPAVLRMRHSALSALAVSSPRVPAALWRSGAAVAALLVAFMLYMGFWRGDSPTEITAADSTSSASESRPVVSMGSRRYVTNVGEIANYTLVDGSEISLNTDSVVEISYSAARRAVVLRRGQALFHVAKDKSRPFVVTAGDRLVTAVGTAFDGRGTSHSRSCAAHGDRPRVSSPYALEPRAGSGIDVHGWTRCRGLCRGYRPCDELGARASHFSG